jgi:translation initiation factor IF-2
LAFDCKVTPDARRIADESGVTIITADIIYHLTDQFDEYLKQCIVGRRSDGPTSEVSFPCCCSIVASVEPTATTIALQVEEGALYLGTPLCVCVPAPTSESDDGVCAMRVVLSDSLLAVRITTVG